MVLDMNVYALHHFTLYAVCFKSGNYMIYTQEQKFHPSWIIGSLLFSLTVVAGTAYQQGALLSTGVLTLIVFLLLLHAALLAARLQLRINEEGIQYRFFPFHIKTHKVNWQEVEEVKLNRFSALPEYGSWGIRYNFFYGTKLLLPEAEQGFSLN